MRSNAEILNLLNTGKVIHWFRHRSTGQIKDCADHVVSVIQSADPQGKTWERLTPEQVRAAVSPSQPGVSRRGGMAPRERVIPTPALASVERPVSANPTPAKAAPIATADDYAEFERSAKPNK